MSYKLFLDQNSSFRVVNSFFQSTFAFPILLTVAAVFLAYHHWYRRRLYVLGWKLPGPPALPLIGNGLVFMGENKDILPKIVKLVQTYETPLRLWLGPHLVIGYTKPEHIEKILTSPKIRYKHDIYKTMRIYVGDGLVSAIGGEKYKQHKKIIHPLLNKTFVNNNMNVFYKHIEELIEKFKRHVDGETFDIKHIVNNCFADLVAETMYGKSLNAQHGYSQGFVKATNDIYDIGYYRMMRPLYHNNFFFKFAATKKYSDQLIATTRKFTKNIIKQSRKRIKNKNITDDDFAPVVDFIAQHIDENPGSMNDEDFLHHLLTLYMASEDTTTIILSMFCLCLGMYPEYQAKVVEEIRSTVGEKPETCITYSKLTELKYLDMCFREVLRILPIAPIIARKTTEDFRIDGLIIPPECGLVISIFSVHRDPKFWQNPEHYHPDHFLPEFTKTRHNYAYLPFSAGMRSCPGKLIANAIVKLAVIRILQEFEIEADGKLPDVKLKCDISVRPLNGYKLRLKKRIWK